MINLKYWVEKSAHIYTKPSGTHGQGSKITVASIGNTYGIGDSKSEALANLCEKLGAK